LGVTTYISPDETLDILNGSLREHRLKYLPPFLCVFIFEEDEGSGANARCPVQTFILVPSIGPAVDIVERRGLPKMELYKLDIKL
jgi:hypothetical protein